MLIGKIRYANCLWQMDVTGDGSSGLYSITKSGDDYFVAASGGRVAQFDASDPSDIFYKASLKTAGQYTKGVAFKGGYIYASDYSSNSGFSGLTIHLNP